VIEAAPASQKTQEKKTKMKWDATLVKIDPAVENRNSPIYSGDMRIVHIEEKRRKRERVRTASLG